MDEADICWDWDSFFEKDIRLQLSLPDLWEDFMVYVCLGGVNLSSYVQIIRLKIDLWVLLSFVLRFTQNGIYIMSKYLKKPVSLSDFAMMTSLHLYTKGSGLVI